MKKKHVIFDNDETISKYFKDLRKSVLLTQKEEIALTKRIAKGDQLAIHELVKANLKFVVSVAKDYQGQGLSLSDLISEGNYGLIKAAQKFDHKRGFRFISYAVWWVKQSIIQSLNDNSRTVRLPSNIINKISYLKKEIAKFEIENEREPVFGEIFDKDNEIIKLTYFPKCASLNDHINDDGDELIELISVENPEEDKLLVDDRIKSGISKTLSKLNERERDIIECYFGINTNTEAMTLEAIGEKYDLTKERVRQIKSCALRKLRYHSGELQNLINS